MNTFEKYTGRSFLKNIFEGDRSHIFLSVCAIIGMIVFNKLLTDVQLWSICKLRDNRFCLQRWDGYVIWIGSSRYNIARSTVGILAFASQVHHMSYRSIFLPLFLPYPCMDDPILCKRDKHRVMHYYSKRIRTTIKLSN